MKDSGRLQGRQQRFRRHMSGEQRSELQSQTIITHSIDAVSESQRRDLQSHHNSCKRSELQPYCFRTVYWRDKQHWANDAHQDNLPSRCTSVGKGNSETVKITRPREWPLNWLTRTGRGQGPVDVRAYEPFVLRAALLLTMVAHAEHVCCSHLHILSTSPWCVCR